MASVPETTPDDANAAPDPENETTGLPWFRTWRGVYLFVTVCFVAYVIFLVAMPRLLT